MLALAVGPVAAEEGATLAALENAHGRECNARFHYLAFAAEAKRAGRDDVGFLFRVVASAESIHAERLAAVIGELHGRSSWRLESVVVRGTAQNLKTSVDLELWELDRVYPRFADYAREECLYEALATINYARGAEATHAAMFARTLEGLDREVGSPRMAQASLQALAQASPAGTASTYYLCTGDGSVFPSPVRHSCPNCGTRGSRILALVCTTGDPWASVGHGFHQVASP